MRMTSTFSIVGFDQETGELGVAVQSKFLAVGSLCPWVKSGVGAVCSQALTNSNYGTISFELLERGFNVEYIRDKLIESDENREIRQFAIIDWRGDSVAYTGKGCSPYAGHWSGESHSCQGNFLYNELVLREMSSAFECSKGDLAERLILAMQAAQENGGERRGQQSAALIVKRCDVLLVGEMDVVVDLRVDDHLSPIDELKRLLEKHRILYSRNHRDKYYPFIGKTRQSLIEIVAAIRLAEQIRNGSAMTIYELLEAYGRLKGKEAFQHHNINGALVDELVEQYYSLQKS